ncbi:MULTISPECIES: DUF1330 domain-containing protein [unclassified Mycobacterium]|uniref:DUF1330 domain-containing protein n=1 Tax=unclassified Mycobacterium TaxID=2642494 RepID=UPI0007FE2DD1|nr:MULTISPECIES: DUF1330 domain-containing protein [unclassified Mycobacterium]OBI14130.1 hypothetical protein A5713_25940 [Mycobacterium sp. E2497]
MPCYFLAVVDKHDRQRYADYSKANVELLSGLDVKVLAVSDDINVQEGEFDATTVVLLEFADDREFRKWFDSDQYAAVKPIRLKSSTAKFAVTFGEDA